MMLNKLNISRFAIAVILASAIAPNAVAQHDDADEHDHALEEHSEETHEEHDGHEEHVEVDEHDDQGIELAEDVMLELGITTAVAGPGKLNVEVDLPGEIRLNEDRLAHVVPRLAGIVTEVRASLGDTVAPGEVMAVLDSRELADLKAEYLASRERLTLSQATFEREKTLFERKVSSEGEYLEAKQNLSESQIALRAAGQRLQALGFSPEELEQLATQPQQSLTRYEIVAPIAGTIILKHVTLGEAVSDDAEVYVAADLSTLWVDLSVYPEDLRWVQPGQPVSIHAEGYPEVSGELIYVSPTIDEHSRTALARALLPNSEGHWRPGLFVSGHVAVQSEPVDIKVSSGAIQNIENEPHVFVSEADAFSPVPVQVGRSDSEGVEILSGLHSGDRYVSQGAFHLKAERDKESFAHAGHAH